MEDFFSHEFIIIGSLTLMELAILSMFRKRKLTVGEHLAWTIPAMIQMAAIYTIFTYEQPEVQPGFYHPEPYNAWLMFGIVAGSIILFVLLAPASLYPKTGLGWMWLIAVSLVTTALIPWIYMFFKDSGDFHPTTPYEESKRIGRRK